MAIFPVLGKLTHICWITAVNQKKHISTSFKYVVATVDKQTQTDNFEIEIKAKMLGRPGRSPWHATPCQRPLGLTAASPPASCRRLAAAPAPRPNSDNCFSRQRALARTMVTLIARRISPVTLPSCPGPASHPWARLIAATLDSAKISRSLWIRGDVSPRSRHQPSLTQAA